ncbi:MAG TPA: hypothetical protein VIH42_04585 [Thermoguttaceae bacterium]
MPDNAVLIRSRWESRSVEEMRMSAADQAYVVRTINNDIVPVHELSTPADRIEMLALPISRTQGEIAGLCPKLYGMQIIDGE